MSRTSAITSSNNWLRRNWHRVLAHLAGVGTLALLAAQYTLGNLPAPERYLMLRSGAFGLVFLVASFACTPAGRLLRWAGAVQVRRALGLYGFALVCLHLLTYALVETALDLNLIVRDIGERWSMLVGLASFLLLIPLAVTSTRGWQRRLGRRWKILHRLVYLALPLGVVHYFWLERDIKDIPLIFAAAVAVLAVARLPLFRRA